MISVCAHGMPDESLLTRLLQAFFVFNQKGEVRFSDLAFFQDTHSCRTRAGSDIEVVSRRLKVCTGLLRPLDG